MIKSPLRYPGGKNKAVKKLLPFIPDYDEYREPFLGGGSLFVYLKQVYPEKRYLINDIYENLYLFWKFVQTSPNELIEQITFWKQNYSNGKQLYQFLNENIDKFDELKKAAAFFVYNRITFSGTSESGGFSNSAFEKRFTNSSIERVKKLATILHNVQITNLDYSEIVNFPGRNVFMYLDPPYYSATNSALYGKNGHLHKTFDHNRFAEIIRNTNHKYLITYDDSEFIRNLFSFANIYTLELIYGMRNVTENSNQLGKEIIITNYSVEELERNSSKQLVLFD